jgi:hypothetical protein
MLLRRHLSRSGSLSTTGTGYGGKHVIRISTD